MHVCPDWWAGIRPGSPLFPSLTYSSFLVGVRRLLTLVGHPHPHEVGTRDFRRGAAQDIWESSRSVAAVLTAGEWSSSALMTYLKAGVIDADAFLDAICMEDGEQ